MIIWDCGVIILGIAMEGEFKHGHVMVGVSAALVDVLPLCSSA